MTLKTTELKTTKERRDAILRASDRDIIRGSHQLAFIPHPDLKDLSHDADRAEELETRNEVLIEQNRLINNTIADLRAKLNEAYERARLAYEAHTMAVGTKEQEKNG